MAGRPRSDFVVDADAVGRRLRDYRFGHRLTRTEFAAASGVAEKTLAPIERGEVLPSLDTAVRIATAAGRSLDWLVGRSASAMAASPQPVPPSASRGGVAIATAAPDGLRDTGPDCARAGAQTSDGVHSVAAAHG